MFQIYQDPKRNSEIYDDVDFDDMSRMREIGSVHALNILIEHRRREREHFDDNMKSVDEMLVKINKFKRHTIELMNTKLHVPIYINLLRMAVVPPNYPFEEKEEYDQMFSDASYYGETPILPFIHFPPALLEKRYNQLLEMTRTKLDRNIDFKTIYDQDFSHFLRGSHDYPDQKSWYEITNMRLKDVNHVKNVIAIALLDSFFEFYRSYLACYLDVVYMTYEISSVLKRVHEDVILPSRPAIMTKSPKALYYQFNALSFYQKLYALRSNIARHHNHLQYFKSAVRAPSKQRTYNRAFITNAFINEISELIEFINNRPSISTSILIPIRFSYLIVPHLRADEYEYNRLDKNYMLYIVVFNPNKLLAYLQKTHDKWIKQRERFVDTTTKYEFDEALKFNIGNSIFPIRPRLDRTNEIYEKIMQLKKDVIDASVVLLDKYKDDPSDDARQLIYTIKNDVFLYVFANHSFGGKRYSAFFRLFDLDPFLVPEEFLVEDVYPEFQLYDGRLSSPSAHTLHSEKKDLLERYIPHAFISYFKPEIIHYYPEGDELEATSLLTTTSILEELSLDESLISSTSLSTASTPAFR